MSIRLIVNLRAKAGRGADLVAAMLPMTLEVQSEPGCLQYELFQSAQDGDSIVLLETWTSAETLAAHSELMRARPPSPARDLREGAPTVERYESA